MIDKYVEERSRSHLLDKLKEQYEPGPMRHQLYEVLKIGNANLPRPSYAWMFYAGMGDVDLMPVQPEEEGAIKKLLSEGKIVPSLSEDFYMGHKTIRRIKHFDDVHFALDMDAKPLMIEYAHSKDFADCVIRPDKEYDAVIAELKHRIRYNRAKIDEAPVQLQQGPLVFPIHTDKHVIALRDRQVAHDPFAFA